MQSSCRLSLPSYALLAITSYEGVGRLRHSGAVGEVHGCVFDLDRRECRLLSSGATALPTPAQTPEAFERRCQHDDGAGSMRAPVWEYQRNDIRWIRRGAE